MSSSSPRGGTRARREAAGRASRDADRSGPEQGSPEDRTSAGAPSTNEAAEAVSGAPAARPRSTPRTSGRALDPDRLAALEEERDFLLRSLRDLDREHDAGDVDDDDYLALKGDYTTRAAAVIRSIDDGRDRLASARRPRSVWRIALGVALVVMLGIGAGMFVARSSGTRTSGDALTGDVRQTTRDLVARAQELTAQAQQSLQQGDGNAAVESYKGALKAYDDALNIQPENAQALTYRGWLLHSLALQAPPDTATGLDAEALSWLDRAVEADPTFPDARVFRAIMLDDAGRPADALADLDEIDMARLPSYMTQMVQQRRTKIEAELAAASGSATPGTSATTAP